MSVEVSVSSEGSVYLFLSSESDSGHNRRVEPVYLYMVPNRVKGVGASQVLFTAFPVSISDDEWFDYTEYKYVAQQYRVLSQGDFTVIVHKGIHRPKNTQNSWEFLPFYEFSTAIGRSIFNHLNPESESDLPERYPYPCSSLERASRSMKVPWFLPVYDITGRRDNYWIYEHQGLKRALSAGEDSTIRDVHQSIERLEEKYDTEDIEGFPRPDEPEEVSEMFEIDLLSDIPEDLGEGFIEPPIPRDRVHDISFEFRGRSWSIEGIYDPVDINRGWVYLVESEDGFLSGLTQEEARSLIQGDDVHLDMHQDHIHARSRGLDTDLRGGDRALQKEYRGGEFCVSKYRIDGGGHNVDMVHLESVPYKTWKRRKKIRKMKSRTEKRRRDQFSSLAKKLRRQSEKSSGESREVKSKLSSLKEAFGD